MIVRNELVFILHVYHAENHWHWRYKNTEYIHRNQFIRFKKLFIFFSYFFFSFNSTAPRELTTKTLNIFFPLVAITAAIQLYISWLRKSIFFLRDLNAGICWYFFSSYNSKTPMKLQPYNSVNTWKCLKECNFNYISIFFSFIVASSFLFILMNRIQKMS